MSTGVTVAGGAERFVNMAGTVTAVALRGHPRTLDQGTVARGTAREHHIGPFNVNRLRPPTLALMSPSPRGRNSNRWTRVPNLPNDLPISPKQDARDVGSGYPSGLALLAPLVEHLHGT